MKTERQKDRKTDISYRSKGKDMFFDIDSR